ncbi:MAG TPA: hypothetical protein VF499_02680, partial [Afipia sp.]
MAEITDCIAHFSTACPQVTGLLAASSSQFVNRRFPPVSRTLTKRKSTGYPQGYPQLLNSRPE